MLQQASNCRKRDAFCDPLLPYWAFCTVMSCRDVQKKSLWISVVFCCQIDLLGLKVQPKSIPPISRKTSSSVQFETFRDSRMRFLEVLLGGPTTAHMGKSCKCIIHYCTHVRAGIFGRLIFEVAPRECNQRRNSKSTYSYHGGALFLTTYIGWYVHFDRHKFMCSLVWNQQL